MENLKESHFDSLKKHLNYSEHELHCIYISLNKIILPVDDETDLFDIYIDIYINLKTHNAPDTTKDYVLKFYPVVCNAHQAYMAIAFTETHMNNPKFRCDSDGDMAMMNLYAQNFEQNENQSAKNDRNGFEHILDEDWGLAMQKPVFVNGMYGLRRYLWSLHLHKPGDLKFNRLGSNRIDGIAGMIDIYEMFDLEDNTKGIVFINMYSHLKIEFPPKGLLYLTDDGEILTFEDRLATMKLVKKKTKKKINNSDQVEIGYIRLFGVKLHWVQLLIILVLIDIVILMLVS